MAGSRPFLGFALLAAAGCASATQPAAPLEAVGIGLASRLGGAGARTGMTFSYWTSGYRGWGSFAKLRVDAVTGLDFLFDDPDDQDEFVNDDPLLDEHVGAIVFDMGLVYRVMDNFALYGGVGLGNLYDYAAVELPDGRVDRSVSTIEWNPNFTGGLLWLWGGSGAGLDVGFDTFDRSFRMGLVVNYGGAGDGGLWSD